MELFSIKVRGYRRFKRESTLRTNGKLLAILGPNEAGKSTLLSAISHIGNNEAPAPGELSRGVDPDEFLIEGKFLLDGVDLNISRLTGPRWLCLQKRIDGQRTYSFEPPAPKKDNSHRLKAWEMFQTAHLNDRFSELISENNSGLISQIIDLLSDLRSAPEVAPKAVLANLQIVDESLASLREDDFPAKYRKVITALKNLAEKERAPTPDRFALDALWPRLPTFLFFDDDARSLSTSYSISTLRHEIPTALENLADVAELQFKDLFAAIDAGNNGAITTIERRANRKLEEKFGETWQQSTVHTAFRVAGDVLEIQAVDENEEFTAFAERSDGLRQFVALQAFATCKQVANPILLIDEAEQRLHYDAQADLVQMLARQEVSPKVVYTTHSAGCLPEDLGYGVRLVRPDRNDLSGSEIVNKFWAIDGDGFAPLLYGMGASTLAFFPTRRAVMVEGPVDMLLYPPMFREVLGRESLGFQFVPGLSIAEHPMTPLLLQHEKGIFYIVDGDGGGAELLRQLISNGVSEGCARQLKNSDGTAVEIEDFVRPDLLLAAANRLLNTFFPNAQDIRPEDVLPKRRMESLERAYRERSDVAIPKIELAYAILAILEQEPGATIVDPRRSRAFKATADAVVNHFQALAT